MAKRALVVIWIGLLVSCASTPVTTKPADPEQTGPEVREGRWPIRDTRLFVRDVGPRDAPVLVVVHGGPGGNHNSLRPLEALAPAYRVVLYDQRGTGQSDRLPVSLKDPKSLQRLSLEQNVADLEALRQKLGRDRISLIGHSWGGALAVFYAAAHPQHVEKLVVYSGGPETRYLAQQKKKAHNARLTAEENKLLGQRMQGVVAAVKGGLPQEELDRRFTELASVLFPALYCQRPAPGGQRDTGRGGFWANQVLGEYVETFHYDDIADGLAKVQAPVLLTWGKCEPSPRQRLTNLLDLLPHARFVIFKESGHNAMEEQERLFFATLRAFLAGDKLPLVSYGPDSPLPGAPFAPRRRRLDHWGDRLTRWLYEGKLEQLTALFSPQLRQALPPDKLQAFQRGLMEHLGREKQVLDKAHSVLPSANIYRRIVRFGKDGGKDAAEKEVSWTLAGLERERPEIAGFHVRDPIRPAASERLDYRTKTALRLPFRGEWFVAWGGRAVAQNYHARARDQRFASDFLVVKGGKTHGGDGKQNEQYYCFGRPILAAGAGTVVAAENGVRDRPPGVMLKKDPLGNHVIIDHGNGEFSFYCHLKRGSVMVQKGQKVAAGAQIGQCGNSGHTSEPHLHFHMQDSPVPFKGTGIPAQFMRYRAGGEPVQRGEPLQGQVIEAVE